MRRKDNRTKEHECAQNHVQNYADRRAQGKPVNAKREAAAIQQEQDLREQLEKS